MRRWLWLHFTRDGRDERLAAKRYQAMLDRGREQIRAMHASGELKAKSPGRVWGEPVRYKHVAAETVYPPVELDCAEWGRVAEWTPAERAYWLEIEDSEWSDDDIIGPDAD